MKLRSCEMVVKNETHVELFFADAPCFSVKIFS